MTRGEFLFFVVFWKLMCLLVAETLIYATLMQPKPPDVFEIVVVSVMAFAFTLAAIFTRLGDE